MDSELDFKELSNDTDIINRMTELVKAVDEIQEVLKFIENPELYDKLSNEEKIKYNLLMSFSLNSLFWMYLRLEGIDPTKHQIKVENERLREAMTRAKQIYDRNTKMPRLDKDAAKRFIRSGLWVPGQKSDGVIEINDETEENSDK